MSKLILAILTVAAFVYACWLVFFRRPFPDPREASGLRRRFFLASLLFVSLLQPAGCRDEKPVVTCYEMPPASQPSNQPKQGGLTTLRAAWRALDPKRGEDFRRKLEAAVGEGAIRQKTADMLAVAYKELSYHKQRTRSREPQPTCYEPTILGSTMMTSRENALKQIELLEKARTSGTIDDRIVQKARETLARELEMLYQADQLGVDQRNEAEDQLARQYTQHKIAPSDPARQAARLIVDMGGEQ